MANDSLTNELDSATVIANVADSPTQIAEWDVPDGETWVIREGDPVVMDVEETATGNNLSASSRFALGFREPQDILNVPTLFVEFSVTPYNQLSLADQLSEENAQRRTLRFNPEAVPGGVLRVEDADYVELWLTSPEVINTANLFVEYPMTVNND